MALHHGSMFTWTYPCKNSGNRLNTLLSSFASCKKKAKVRIMWSREKQHSSHMCFRKGERRTGQNKLEMQAWCSMFVCFLSTGRENWFLTAHLAVATQHFLVLVLHGLFLKSNCWELFCIFLHIVAKLCNFSLDVAVRIQRGNEVLQFGPT